MKGLPWSAKTEAISTFFSNCGTVVSCITPDPGNAYVEFETEDAYHAGLALDGNEHCNNSCAIACDAC